MNSVSIQLSVEGLPRGGGGWGGVGEESRGDGCA